MTGWPRVLKFVRGATAVVALFSFCLGLYSATRWNELFLKAKPVAASNCQSRPAEFQVVIMKSSVCVPRATAEEWKKNARLLAIAEIGFFGFLLVSAATDRKAEEDEPRSQSRIAPVALVVCTGLLLFWGVWPAAIAAVLFGVAMMGKWLLLDRA